MDCAKEEELIQTRLLLHRFQTEHERSLDGLEFCLSSDGRLTPTEDGEPWLVNLSGLLEPLVTEAAEFPLFDFQKSGVEWLLASPRAILADDMGLGKTLQAIAAAYHLIRSGQITRAIIIAPRSLIFNWREEFKKWTPELRTTVIESGSRTQADVWRRKLLSEHVIITSYDQIREGYKNLAFQNDLIIADEAHRLRNRKSLQSKAVAELESNRLWLLSGTPIERDLEDLLTLMALLVPAKFSLNNQNQNPELLKMRAKSYILRRNKEDVLDQLPELTVIHEVLELTETQRLKYNLIRADRTIKPAIKKFGALRAFCDLDPESNQSSKIDRILEKLDVIRSSGESVVVFSFWNDALVLLEKEIQSRSNFEVHKFYSSQTLKSRAATISQFRSMGGILLASAHIASEGLTLTEANHVIFINRWWNPSLNNQASDRIRRIGQKRATFVHTFTMSDTVEESLDKMLESKTLTEEEFIESLAKSIELD